MFCTIARIFVLSTETIGSNLMSFVGTSPTWLFHKMIWILCNLPSGFVKRSYISISLHFCESWTHVNIHHWDSFTLKNCYFIARLCSLHDFIHNFNPIPRKQRIFINLEIVPIKISYCPSGFTRIIFFAFVWLLPFIEFLTATVQKNDSNNVEWNSVPDMFYFWE